MNETKLSPRQKFIINVINQAQGLGRAAIEEKIAPLYPSSKPTVARDLASLTMRGILKTSGRGRSIVYLSASANALLRVFDFDQYFALEPDQRVNAKKSFDFSVFENLKNLFTKSELEAIGTENRKFSAITSKLDRTVYSRELERFIIELAWKSSKIEGNTYSLLETENLITQKIEAKGRTGYEATMILNHKKAFESILEGRSEYKVITVSKISQLHEVLVRDLSITPGIRKQAVGITGTTFKPLDNEWQIGEALEKMAKAVNDAQNPLEKALIVVGLISYIQPFADGNKRTGRMLANAVLLAQDYYPLSYRSVDEETYKKALILFYEQSSIQKLKEIIINQYRFALSTYFT